MKRTRLRTSASAESATWRPPTRRAFVAMLGAAVAAIAMPESAPMTDPPRSTWTGKTRWIGHC